ncbi:cobalamin biosynthesis protein [Nocardia brasiliensis]|uniref:Cobalamin biosynthesis protein n=1 Tax=Nocardia brasiliensis TaxID=37326 RepID=A0A6G9XWB9_NOCBR|nr:cobalamin biosynthesis protein [Nocardia brasiliensis]QIS05150.1 cobalamin biosynthesis protein [Nocardia brasiliensis]
MSELVVGLGLRPGTPADLIVRVVREIVGENTINCLATLDRRAAEASVRAAAAELGVPIRAFTATELAKVTVPNPTSRTATAIGTPSVAEAAALLAAGTPLPLLLPKHTTTGLVLAIAEADIHTSFRDPHQF